MTTNEPPTKIANIESNGSDQVVKKIGTHDGKFHCDEVLACYMLKQLPEYRKSKIIRSRVPAVLDGCDIVVDVGGIFDPEKNRFDHHQRSFEHSMNSLNKEFKWITKLSSAGLIYLHFGKRVLTELMLPQVFDEGTMNVMHYMMYENFVEEIDAVDNGIDQCVGEVRYHVSTTISSRVSRLNPSWNEDEVDEEKSFYKAMELVGDEFKSRLLGLVNNWLPARVLVKQAVASRFDVDGSGEIMELKKFCPWKEHLFSLEENKNMKPVIKYVIYEDNSGKARVQCVSNGRNTFENRLSLPAEWRGVRDEELSKISGIPGCIFVHANGFIGGNLTRQGALEMARKSIQMQANCI